MSYSSAASFPSPPSHHTENIAADVGLGQGDAAGNSLADGADNVSEAVWERVGDNESEQYQTMYNELDDLRQHMDATYNLTQIVDDLGGLPAGMRLSANIRGISIGELCRALIIKYGYLWLRGLFLYATVRDVHVCSIDSEAGDLRFNTYMQDTNVRHVPLWKVLPVEPIRYNMQPQVGGTLAEHIEGIKRLFRVRLNFMFGMIDEHHVSELSGSDVANFFLLDDVAIIRRNAPPTYFDTRLSPIRTGGFGEIIAHNEIFAFSLGQFAVEYKKQLELLHPRSVVDSVEDHTAFLLHLLQQVNAWPPGQPCIFSVVVPGGVGCCVDNCIDASIHLANSKGLTNIPLPLSSDNWSSHIRAEAKRVYVVERLAKEAARVNKRKRTSSAFDVDYFTRKYNKEFEDATKLGYSFYFLRYIKDAAYNLYNIEPRVFYERFEELTPNNDEAEMRMSRRIREIIPVDRGASAMLHIPMLRINSVGEVHRHYPKSYYISKNKNQSYIDADSGHSGILHSIGIIPFLSEPIFTEKVFFKTLTVMIESFTKPFMAEARARSYGDYAITGEELAASVEYQLKRHEASKTTTLIYGNNKDELEEDEVVPQQIVYSNFIPRPLVIAYDIETVEMTNECVLAGAVPEKFLRLNPDTNKYEQINRQIPYMIQWVPVNLSDEGDLLRKKAEKFYRVENFDSFEGWDDYIYSDDNQATKKGWIVLDEVHLEYGGRRLGQCVEDFIENATNWAVLHGYTSVSAYAHNGSRFDSILIQAFNTRYPIARLLDVRGAVLSMRLKVPYLREDTYKNLSFSFGDTQRFLAGSLGALCKDFKVPTVWSKLDFPITRIDWRNCYTREIMDLVAPYGANDAYCLAFLITKINQMLCLNQNTNYDEDGELIINLDPTPFETLVASLPIVNLRTMAPPITQFCTIMSFVKRVLRCYIDSTIRTSLRPSSVDIPSLRHWIDMALVGGRVSAYAKMYKSSFFSQFLCAYLRDDTEDVKTIVQEAMVQDSTMVVLDMTSLYPSAMTQCPLPMGKIRSLSISEAQRDIDAIGCPVCEELMSLCPQHKLTDTNLSLRPFSIILVRNFQPGWVVRTGILNLVGRKIRPTTYKNNLGVPVQSDNFTKSESIDYSLETEEEATQRLWGSGEGEQWNVYGVTQAYSNIDLYWAQRCGFTFDIVGGMGWEMSACMSQLYQGLFDMRVAAKGAKNFSLQLALKNLLNGGYGVHCQKLINSLDKVVKMPEAIYDVDIKDQRVSQYMRDFHHAAFDSRYILKENIPLATKQSFVRAKMTTDMGDIKGGASPNHVGAAVLAWSRHLMNLVMVPVMTADPAAITYTDTDSMAMQQSMYTHLREGRPHLFDDRGITLGTFKNDHSDHFPNARVLFSAMGGKKVKMHVVACPDTGKIKICNTFKGYMVEGTDNEGRKYSADRAMHGIATSLLDILYDLAPAPHVGTRWTRDLSTGVRIEKGVEVQSTTQAYLNHSAAFLPMIRPNSDLVVVCVPHGANECHGSFKTKNFDFEHWREYMETRLPRQQMTKFLAKYYDQKDEFYMGLDVEEWIRQNDIIDGATLVVPPSPEGEQGDPNSSFAQQYLVELEHDSPIHMPFESTLASDEEGEFRLSDGDFDFDLDDDIGSPLLFDL